MYGVSWFLVSLLCPKTEENFPPWDLNIIFWKLLINWDYDKFCRTGLPHVFIMTSTVDYRGSKLITHDYYWLFSMYGYPLLQTLVCKADWQYHGGTSFGTILTVEYIMLILLLQYVFLLKSWIPPGHILLFIYIVFESSLITTPVSSHKVRILPLGFTKFKFSLSSGIFIGTSDNSPA